MKRVKNPHKMVSLFSGIGGFELAFQRIDVPTALMCEIDPIAQRVLRTNFPEVRLVDDICKLKKLPRGTDVVCAGFPCQDLSTIGVKKGMSGERSSLIKEVLRLLGQSKVEWVLIENVTNMLHLHKGETIKTILNGLEGLGYKWAYRVIDSLAFVPQHRRRVYVVASLTHNPNDVLLSGIYPSAIEVIDPNVYDAPCGFYWTEGKYALGMYKNGIPTLKCGSTIGIPSAPAIAFPNGNVGCPDIRDAERFQGFPENWTLSAEEVARPSSRWKLVGNAVTVDSVAWIANKIIHPERYDGSNDKEMVNDTKWPDAAWGDGEKRYISSSNAYPVERAIIPLSDFLNHPCTPLSLKAATGFEDRLNIGTVRCSDHFRTIIHQYVISKLEENGRNNN